MLSLSLPLVHARTIPSPITIPFARRGQLSRPEHAQMFGSSEPRSLNCWPYTCGQCVSTFRARTGQQVLLCARRGPSSSSSRAEDYRGSSVREGLTFMFLGDSQRLLKHNNRSGERGARGGKEENNTQKGLIEEIGRWVEGERASLRLHERLGSPKRLAVLTDSSCGSPRPRHRRLIRQKGAPRTTQGARVLNLDQISSDCSLILTPSTYPYHGPPFSKRRSNSTHPTPTLRSRLLTSLLTIPWRARPRLVPAMPIIALVIPVPPETRVVPRRARLVRGHLVLTRERPALGITAISPRSGAYGCQRWLNPGGR